MTVTGNETMTDAGKAKSRRDGSDILAAIVAAFAAAQRAGLPKVAQLYDAISQLIASGQIPQGAKLPGERELSAALKISLGTAQKSLNSLMNAGELIRQHGRGTFARGSRRALSELWHYRFRDSDGRGLLPVYATVVDRALITQDRLLEASLGGDAQGYVRIRRRINIGDKFFCWSEIFLGATRFRRLLRLPISDVESANLKQILNDKFNAPTLAVSQTGRIQGADNEICRQLGVPARTKCLLLQVVATSRRREPISFQRIYIPPVDYELELTEGPGAAAGSALAA